MRQPVSDSDGSGKSGFQTTVNGFLLQPGLPFAEVVTSEEIERIFRKHGGLFGENGIYSTGKRPGNPFGPAAFSCQYRPQRGGQRRRLFRGVFGDARVGCHAPEQDKTRQHKCNQQAKVVACDVFHRAMVTQLGSKRKTLCCGRQNLKPGPADSEAALLGRCCGDYSVTCDVGLLA